MAHITGGQGTHRGKIWHTCEEEKAHIENARIGHALRKDKVNIRKDRAHKWNNEAHIRGGIRYTQRGIWHTKGRRGHT